MSWSLPRSANAGFAFACAILLAVDIVAYQSLTRLLGAASEVAARHAVLDEVAHVLEHLQNAETGQRGYLLTGDDRYLEPYHAATMELDRDLSELRALTTGDPLQQRRLEVLAGLVAEKLAELSDTVEARRQGGLDHALPIVRTDRGKRLMDAIRSGIREIESTERRRLAAGREASQRRVFWATTTVAVGSALGILILALAALASHRELARRREAELALESARAGLEARVAERTAALARTNAELGHEAEARRRAAEALEASEARYRRLFEECPVGVCHYDQTGRVVDANGQFLALLRLDATSVKSQALADVLPLSAPPTPGRTLEARWTPARGGPDEQRWLSIGAVALEADHGGEPGGLVVVQDITDRRRAEDQRAQLVRQLEANRDDVVSILDSLHVGTALVDAVGRVSFVSQTAERMFGRPATSLVQRDWREAFSADEDRRRVAAALGAPAEIRTRVPVRLEHHGRVRWLEIDVRDDPRDPSRRLLFLNDTSEVQVLRRRLDEQSRFEGLVGRSEPMQLVYRRIRELSAVDTTVLIEGETGTGKELVARALHAASHRRPRPFIAVNCAGLTESLLTSQLFGHRRGAFTGAVRDHTGVFEAANGGTLFLDEIGDLPLTLQASVLRALQEREIVRLGESHPVSIDVRILAATNQDLVAATAEGRFRQDLLYRVRVARIELPPLRHRLDDLPVLAAHFLDECRALTAHPVEEVGQAVLRALADYDWPGNVRELRSAIECAAIRCSGRILAVGDLPREVVAGGPTRRPTPSARRVDLDQAALLEVLTQMGGNRQATARRLGISRATLYRRLPPSTKSS